MNNILKIKSGGFGGTILGGFIGDKLKNRIRNPYFFTSFVSLIPAILLAIILLFVSKYYNIITLKFLLENSFFDNFQTSFFGLLVIILLAQVCLWIYTGPMNALLANSGINFYFF